MSDCVFVALIAVARTCGTWERLYPPLFCVKEYSESGMRVAEHPESRNDDNANVEIYFLIGAPRQSTQCFHMGAV